MEFLNLAGRLPSFGLGDHQKRGRHRRAGIGRDRQNYKTKLVWCKKDGNSKEMNDWLKNGFGSSSTSNIEEDPKNGKPSKPFIPNRSTR